MGSRRSDLKRAATRLSSVGATDVDVDVGDGVGN